MREESFVGATFSPAAAWTAAPPIAGVIGQESDATASLTARYAAVEMRDNLASFASANDARDQARGMLVEMRGYA